MSTIITSIDPGSPAMRAGLRPGQQLLSINGHDVVDVLDYRFYGYDPVSHLMLKNETDLPRASPFTRLRERTWG